MTEVMGGGVVLAVAAALWLIYLLPTLMSRRQYISTERNAVRLQQTLRILAETSEVPREVRLEATARDVAAQQRLLRGVEDRARLAQRAADDLLRAEQLGAEALAKDAASAARAAEQKLRAAAERAAAAERVAARAGADARRRVRRARAVSSLVLLLSLGTVTVGGIQLATGGTAVVVGIGTVGVLGAFATLNGLARAARNAPSLARAAVIDHSASSPVQAFVPVEWAEATPVASTGWTPRQLPQPLYMQRGSAAAQTLDAAAAAADLRAASAESERALRAAASVPGVTPITRSRPAARSHPVDNRFAAMGVVGHTAPGQAVDLDAVLRRRRATA